MTKEDINDNIKILCPNDEDFEKLIISPAYIKKEFEDMAEKYKLDKDDLQSLIKQFLM